MHKIGSIILVDDDELIIAVNSLVVEELNISKEVRPFISGIEALEYLEKMGGENVETPAILIVDLNMPEISGEEFVLKFLQIPFLNRHRIKIVIYSALLPAKKYDYLKNLGVHEFLEKPLTEAKIRQLLTRIRIDF